MAKNQPPELPYVGMLTDDEISQAIGNHFVKKYMGLDPDTLDCEFKVSYRNVKTDTGYRLFAPIVVTSVQPIDPAIRESKPATRDPLRDSKSGEDA